MSPVTLGSGRQRVPNNIKRYRRQVCKICSSSVSVPFLRAKMLHAATHSPFKRYKCPYCDKRGASTASATLHIKSKHPGKPPNEFLDEMYERGRIHEAASTHGKMLRRPLCLAIEFKLNMALDFRLPKIMPTDLYL
ncbi:unnamed protein product [Cylicostephanus goldi]|uniref:C2H2-type domain-containing protein n=1 Tax=Cylicostephanus goldi TaxID=71465 RepID=A0A3P6RAZ4_CYLGO|nr:unnamed protein product [Cylicostephanus goldi]